MKKGGVERVKKSVAACYIEQNRILLITDDKDRTSFPAGGFEPEDQGNWKMAAVRELWEETGIENPFVHKEQYWLRNRVKSRRHNGKLIVRIATLIPMWPNVPQRPMARRGEIAEVGFYDADFIRFLLNNPDKIRKPELTIPFFKLLLNGCYKDLLFRP